MTTTTDLTTPRPWDIGDFDLTLYASVEGSDGPIPIADFEFDQTYWDETLPSEEEALANAQFVVQAVNAHEDLVEALRDIVSFLDEYGREGYCLVCCPPEPGEHIEGDCELLTARAALAKAEGA
jgi:hypothetical protein